MASQPLFGIIPAGLPAITQPSATPSPTSVLYGLPTSKRFDHIVVFLLPDVTLPQGTAASIYLSTASNVENFKFLGAIGPGKESAMFKVGSSHSNGEELVIGVSIEAEDAVAQQMQNLASAKSSGSAGGQPGTAVLAQRIIQNAFNFLAGFSGTTGPGGVEVVPLKAFEDWWKKFESRVRADPSFLEKQTD